MQVIERLRRGWVGAILLALAIPAAAAAQPQAVPGMRVLLQPPAGFEPADRFAGFQRVEERASIMVTEIPTSFAEMDAGLNAQALATQGMTLRDSEPFSADGLRGRLLSVTQQGPDGATYEKWVLFFGSDSVTAIVTATYPQAVAGTLSQPMKQAVLSSRWSSQGPADRLAGLPFRITERPRLRIANRTGNMLLLNGTGALPHPPGSPMLMVAPSISEGDMSDLEGFARRRLGQTEGMTGLTNLTGTSLTVDGATAYELVADAADAEDGTPVKLYQLVLAEGRHYILVQGFAAPDKAAEFIPEFREVARSLRRNR